MSAQTAERSNTAHTRTVTDTCDHLELGGKRMGWARLAQSS